MTEVKFHFSGEVIMLTEPEMYQIVMSRFPEGDQQAQVQRVMAVVREGDDIPEVLFQEEDEANHYLLEGLNRLNQGLMQFPPDEEREKVLMLDMNYEVVAG